MKNRNFPRLLLGATIVGFGLVQPSLAGPGPHDGLTLAYIGPGAGFAVAGSFLVLLGTFLMAFGIILIWPLKAVFKLVARRGRGKAKVKRVVVIGLDGFDPQMAARYADRMPNFKRLQAQGCHHSLGTSIPSISPVAWSTFATGCLLYTSPSPRD